MENQIDLDSLNSIVNDALYSGCSKFLIDTSHRQLARFGNKTDTSYGRILEIGAGRGEHFEFVSKNFSEYVMTDISDWGVTEIQAILKKEPRVQFQIQDMQNMSFEDGVFDRVIVSCVLAHVVDPYRAMSEVKRVSKKGATCSFFISADPGVLMRYVRALITRPKMKGLEIPYSLLNAISHRNSAHGILQIAKHVFRNDQIKIRYYPFRIRSWNLSTHIILNVKILEG
jgi:phosphatidylethanolamine/phosphatidyl-N-methylethanolamine N-methyltransferase